MGRNRFGQFTREAVSIKVRDNIAYVAVWHKNQVIRAVFDKEDIPKINDLGSFCLRGGYVCYRGKTGLRQVARIIMDCPENMVVDHINGDKLDNRKSNLRIVTQLINSQNRTKLNKNNTSGVRGVISPKYGASVMVNGKRIHLGAFDNIEEAVLAIEKVSGRKPRSANKQSKTGIRGVYPIKTKAMIRIGGRRHYLGSFDTIEEAEKAVKETQE